MLAESATSPDCAASFESHLGDTRAHVNRLDQVFWLLDGPAAAKMRGRGCHPRRVHVRPGRRPRRRGEGCALDGVHDTCRAVRESGVHYTRCVGRQMRHPEVADLLRLTLEEETRAGPRPLDAGRGALHACRRDQEDPPAVDRLGQRPRRLTTHAGAAKLASLRWESRAPTHLQGHAGGAEWGQPVLEYRFIQP